MTSQRDYEMIGASISVLIMGAITLFHTIKTLHSGGYVPEELVFVLMLLVSGVAFNTTNRWWRYAAHLLTTVYFAQYVISMPGSAPEEGILVLLLTILNIGGRKSHGRNR